MRASASRAAESLSSSSFGLLRAELPTFPSIRYQLYHVSFFFLPAFAQPTPTKEPPLEPPFYTATKTKVQSWTPPHKKAKARVDWVFVSSSCPRLSTRFGSPDFAPAL